MPYAWEITTGNPNVVIAVVDTGVDPTLPDLQGALAPGWDFVDNDSLAEDQLGHGTAVATEIVARGNNGQGIAGYCWRCRVMPVRVSRNGHSFDPVLVSRGITWAADSGASIISLSFSDEGTASSAHPQVAAAIDHAARKNVLVVASAGNSGLPNPTYPAANWGAYGVASTDQWDHLFSWTTFGSWVSLAAPGCQVMMIPGGFWYDPCGSSAAAPAVAGIAGLMLSVNPSLRPPQIISALQQTAVPVAGIGGGRIDAFLALLAVGGKVPPPTPPQPPPLLPSLPAPPVQRPPTWQPGPPPPQAETRVQRGVLQRHRALTIKVKKGRVAATLQSLKATSCVVSLRSSSELWVSTPARPGSVRVTVSAKVPAGRYKVEVWCNKPQPKRFALYVRAIFN